jgi:hypothetical protein
MSFADPLSSIDVGMTFSILRQIYISAVIPAPYRACPSRIEDVEPAYQGYNNWANGVKSLILTFDPKNRPIRTLSKKDETENQPKD